MKALYERWTAISLPKRILGGMILGAVLGMVIPQAVGISILGNLFVNALKGIAPLLVFFLVISSLCQAKQSHGGIIRTVVCLYLFNTLLGAVIAVVASKLFPITLTLAQAAEETSAPQGIAEVLQTLLLNVVKNPITSIAEANYIGILAWAVLFGVAMRGASERTKEIMDNFAAALSKVVTWIINFAPFGILGLVFDTVSTNGLQVFTEYGRLLAVLVGSMLFIYFVTNPILVYWCIRQNPFPLIFKCLKRSAVTAFFTRSSAANIPINMEVCEEMGLDKLRYHPARCDHQYERCGCYHHRHDAGGSQYAGNSGGYSDRHHFKRPVGTFRLRRIRCCRWFPALNSACLLLVWHLQRCGHAGHRCRIYHRRGAGFRRDRPQLLLRPAALSGSPVP